MAEYIVELLASFCAVIIVLTLHEFAHAYVAYKCGDPTPKWSGRLSLNPLRHFDLFGLLCFTFVGFGWAKPVSINPENFRNYRAGLGLTACAGIVVNYLTALLIYPVYLVVVHYMPEVPFVTLVLEYFFYLVFAYSLSFFVFNLLPLYPLDGFRILDAVKVAAGFSVFCGTTDNISCSDSLLRALSVSSSFVSGSRRWLGLIFSAGSCSLQRAFSGGRLERFGG